MSVIVILFCGDGYGDNLAFNNPDFDSMLNYLRDTCDYVVLVDKFPIDKPEVFENLFPGKQIIKISGELCLPETLEQLEQFKSFGFQMYGFSSNPQISIFRGETLNYDTQISLLQKSLDLLDVLYVSKGYGRPVPTFKEVERKCDAMMR